MKVFVFIVSIVVSQLASATILFPSEIPKDQCGLEYLLCHCCIIEDNFDGEELSGIDMFIGTVIHEKTHIEQILKADTLVASSGDDCFRYGWSWGQNVHNHWEKGHDGGWGEAGVDDDGNGVVDDANAIPWGDTFEPGHGDDLSLVSPDWDDWPAAWQLPNAMFLMVHPIECEAINATNSELDENDYAEDDWANPGKQHQTLNDWRD